MMEEPVGGASQSGKAYFTGHDLGVVLCRGLTVILLFQGLSQFVDVLKMNSLYDFWTGDTTVLVEVFSVVMTLILVLGIYLVVAIILWKNAGRVASRMVGDAAHRVLFSGLSVQAVVRVVVACIGFWFCVIAIMSLFSVLIGIAMKYEFAGYEGSLIDFFRDQDRVSGGADLFYALVSQIVYLAGGIICVVGAVPLSRLLMRRDRVATAVDESSIEPN